MIDSCYLTDDVCGETSSKLCKMMSVGCWVNLYRKGVCVCMRVYAHLESFVIFGTSQFLSNNGRYFIWSVPEHVTVGSSWITANGT